MSAPIVVRDGVHQRDGRIPAIDRGALYGDAALEVLRTRGRRWLDVRAHCARLDQSCRRLGIDARATIEGVGDDLALARSLADDERELYARVTISRGEGLGLSPTRADRPHRTVIVDAIAASNTDGPPPLTLVAFDEVLPRSMLGAEGAKVSGYLAHVLALVAAGTAGSIEPLWIDEGRVVEAGSACVLARFDQVLHAPLDARGLAGITRAHLVAAAPSLGLAVDVGPLSLERLVRADEVMIASTVREIVPVEAIVWAGRAHRIAAPAPGSMLPALLAALRRRQDESLEP